MKYFFLSVLPLCAAAAACSSDTAQYDASGVFETTEVIVSAQTAGEILRFDVEEGDTLTASRGVGLVDTVQLSLQRRQLVAGLSATDSRRLDERKQVAALEQQLENLRGERARFAALVAEKAATQKQVDDIDHQVEVVSRQLAAAREQVESTNRSLRGQTDGIVAQIEQIDDRIRRSTIASPIDGIVLSKYAERGELAAVGTPLFKVGDTRHMRLRAYVTADLVTTLRLGQTVTVLADVGTDGRRSLAGRITWISSKAEFTPKTIQTRDERANLVYAVKIDVENDGTIKAGMYGDVKF